MTGFLRRHLGARSHKVGSAPPRDPVVASWFGGGATASGQTVNADKALSSIWVYACVRVLAETLASVPWNVYRRTDKGGRERDRDHALWPILHDQPNHWQTSFEFREMMMGHTALRGNGYAEIVSTNGNPVSELIPLHPDRVRPFRAPDRTIVYDYQPPGGPSRIILQHEMFHVRGLSTDGLVGLNPIQLHRETIGEDFAAQDYGARFWADDATPPGILKMAGHFKDDEAAQRFKKSWQEAQSGVNRHKTAVLEEGMDYQAIGLNHVDAEYIEGRKFGGLQIARMFRMVPHIIAILDRSTNNNIEHQGIEFVTHTMQPWFVRWEQAARRDLFTEAGRRTHFNEFLLDGLLRGDTKARREFYHSGVLDGWMTRNEVRAKENLNHIEGLDEPLVPVNMTLSDALKDLIEENTNADQ